jgi:hypothetical protein
MASTELILTILGHAPRWVWPLLAALILLGALQARARQATLLRATLLPVAMLALSLWGVVSVFLSAAALAAWAVAAAAAAGAVLRRGAVAGARWSAREQRLHLPGSWVPMMLILAIFVTKFGVGASLGLHPALSDNASFAFAVCAAYGLFSGVFAGRALALRRLATSPAQAAAPESAA